MKVELGCEHVVNIFKNRCRRKSKIYQVVGLKLTEKVRVHKTVKNSLIKPPKRAELALAPVIQGRFESKERIVNKF
jgi:hypothetical protein